MKFFGRSARKLPMHKGLNDTRMLAYALYGCFAGDMRFDPPVLSFTPETHNAHWRFLAKDYASLGLYLNYIYTLPGPQVILHDHITDEYIGYLISNTITSFFYRTKDVAIVHPPAASEEDLRAQVIGDIIAMGPLEPNTDFIWQGHFFWSEEEGRHSYCFEIVGAYKELDNIAIRFLLLRQIDTNPLAFFRELRRLFNEFDGYPTMPLDKRHIADVVSSTSDLGAARRYKDMYISYLRSPKPRSQPAAPLPSQEGQGKPRTPARDSRFLLECKHCNTKSDHTYNAAYRRLRCTLCGYEHSHTESVRLFFEHHKNKVANGA